MKELLKRFLVISLLGFSLTTLASPYLPHQQGDHSYFTDINGSAHEVRMEVLDTIGTGNFNRVKLSNFLGNFEQWIEKSDYLPFELRWVNTQGVSQTFVDFSDPVGTTYPITLNDCTSTPRISEKNISLSTSAGDFNNVIKLEFSNNCYHKSLDYAYFHPGVGLLQWKEFLYTGSYLYSLNEAYIDGKTYPRASQISSSSLLTDGVVNLRYQDHAYAQITLTNTSNEPANFTFFSGQDFEIEIIDLYGRVVNRWSVNKFFTQAVRNVSIEAWESLLLGDQISLVDFYGHPLQLGGYTLRIFVNGQAENSPENISAESFIFLTYY